jgi:hypothetical protein
MESFLRTIIPVIQTLFTHQLSTGYCDDNQIMVVNIPDDKKYAQLQHFVFTASLHQEGLLHSRITKYSGPIAYEMVKEGRLRKIRFEPTNGKCAFSKPNIVQVKHSGGNAKWMPTSEVYLACSAFPTIIFGCYMYQLKETQRPKFQSLWDASMPPLPPVHEVRQLEQHDQPRTSTNKKKAKKGKKEKKKKKKSKEEREKKKPPTHKPAIQQSRHIRPTSHPVTPVADQLFPLTPVADQLFPLTPVADQLFPLSPVADQLFPLTPVADQLFPLSPQSLPVTPRSQPTSLQNNHVESLPMPTHTGEYTSQKKRKKSTDEKKAKRKKAKKKSAGKLAPWQTIPSSRPCTPGHLPLSPQLDLFSQCSPPPSPYDEFLASLRHSDDNNHHPATVD